MKTIHNHVGGRTPDWHHRAVLPTMFCHQELAREGIRLYGQDAYAIGERFTAYMVHRLIEAGHWAYIDVVRDLGRHVVWELDDDMWNVPPGFAAHGIIESCHERVDWLKARASLIVTSTRELAERVGEPDRTVVCPNLLDPRGYSWPKSPPKKGGKPKVLWAGANTVDAELLTETVIRLQKEQAAQFLFWGHAPQSLQGRVYVLPSVPFGSWPTALSELGADIVVCPLQDHPFGRCKSELKYLEMSGAGIPGIYSDLPPYECVTHGETGLKVPPGGDWYGPLRALIDSYDLRQHIAVNARRDVLENHCWFESRCRKPWLDMFRRAVA